MKVLVVGATGVLGRAAVRLLRERGVPVRAMTRDVGRAVDLARLGAELVVGDLTEPASLESACVGIDRVLASAHGLLGRGRYRSELVDDAGHRALIDAARHAGVERFVYTSASAVSADHPVDFFRTKHRIEQVLSRSGMAYVILRPTAFMEQHVHEFNGKIVLDRGRGLLIGPGTKMRNFVAGADVARFAVLALTAYPMPGPVIDICGPGNFTDNEVAQMYASLAGLQARVSHLPAPLARGVALLAAPLHPGLARLFRMRGLPDDAYAEVADSGPLQRAFPDLPLTTLETFVRARVAEAGRTPSR